MNTIYLHSKIKLQFLGIEVMNTFLNFIRIALNYFEHRLFNTSAALMAFLSVSLFLFICPNNAHGQSTDICSFTPDNSMPTQAPSNFSPSDHKCVKIKFHFLNNTSNARENVPEQFFLDVLNTLNQDFAKYNISFFPGDECPDLGPENLVTEVVDIHDVSSVFSGSNPPPSEFNKIADVMNLYFFQQDVEPSSAATGNYVNVRRGQMIDLTHEVGHFLGLRHTFDIAREIQIINGVPTNVVVYECKDRNHTNSNGQLTCLLRGDRLCDTGADPHDYHPGIDFSDQNCNSVNLPLSDYCGDGTSKWDVPVRNWMSYYILCTREFSPDQVALMHYNLENNLEKFTYDCPNFDPSCADITISGDEIWPDITVSLCTDQKIIIPDDASLTLVGTTLTKKLNTNSSCPNFHDNWDGIYIIGGSGVSYPGGPTSGSGGKFSATENSVIEYSNKGIQAEKGHLGITISNSILRFNNTAINAGGPGGAIYGGTIKINGSQISNSTNPSPVLIRVNGCNLDVSSSQINNLGSLSITGIKAFNNRVKIKDNTIITGFGPGIDKEMSSGTKSFLGLIIEESKIKNGNLSLPTSIRNRNGLVTAKRNWFEGYIDHYGKAYGNWYGNNFRKDFLLSDPTLSYVLSENNFKNSGIKMALHQDETDATCNNWDHSELGNATLGSVLSIKSTWGSPSISSGNKWNDDQPIMEAAGGSKITNYHVASNPSTIFYYDNNVFRGVNSFPNTSCAYNKFPFSATSEDEEEEESVDYNDEANNTAWSNLNNSYDSLISQLPAADSSSNAQLIAQIENIRVRMGQCVLLALENSDTTMTTNNYDTWVNRADIMFSQQATILNSFNSHAFTSLTSYLNSLSLSGDDANDRNNLIEAVNWLDTLIINGKDIYNLNSVDVAELQDMASNTYGAYTDIIRAFLNIYYDIRIDPPQALAQNSTNKKSINLMQSDYIIIPNPVHDCFSIINRSGDVTDYEVSLNNINGMVIFNKFYHETNNICIQIDLPSGIYLVRIKGKKDSKPFHLKIVKN